MTIHSLIPDLPQTQENPFSAFGVSDEEWQEWEAASYADWLMDAQRVADLHQHALRRGWMDVLYRAEEVMGLMLARGW